MASSMFAKGTLLALVVMGIAATCANAAVLWPERQQLLFQSPIIQGVPAMADPAVNLDGRHLTQTSTNGTCPSGTVFCAPDGCIPPGKTCCLGGYCDGATPICNPSYSKDKPCTNFGSAIKAHLGAVASSLLLAVIVMIMI